MESIKSNLYPCAHCEGSGTCKNSENDTSCAACIKRNELKADTHTGVLCGACGGLGLAEPYTERLNKRIKPLLAMGIVFVLLILLSGLAFTDNSHFTEVLAFSATLIGAIIAYYFSGNINHKTE